MNISALLDTTVPILPWLQWRITRPFEQLAKIGHTISYIHPNTNSVVPQNVDILVLPRIVIRPEEQASAQKWFAAIKSAGTKLVYEADDDIFSEDYVSDLTKVYTTESNRDEPLDIIATIQVLDNRRHAAIWTLQQCDAVTVTTHALAQYVRMLTQAPVYVVPNAIDIDAFNKTLVPDYKWHHTKTVVGWAGGQRVQDDLNDMIEGWNMLAAVQSNVRFVVAGWLHPAIQNSTHLQNRYTHVKWAKMNAYGRSMQVDIGCCAVANTPFSSRKSPIKAWEFALAGAMTITQGDVYIKEMACLAENANDWFRILQYYINDKEYRESLAVQGKNDVYMRHDLKYQYGVWQQTYQQIIGTHMHKEVQYVETNA